MSNEAEMNPTPVLCQVCEKEPAVLVLGPAFACIECRATAIERRNEAYDAATCDVCGQAGIVSSYVRDNVTYARCLSHEDPAVGNVRRALATQSMLLGFEDQNLLAAEEMAILLQRATQIGQSFEDESIDTMIERLRAAWTMSQTAQRDGEAWRDGFRSWCLGVRETPPNEIGAQGWDAAREQIGDDAEKMKEMLEEGAIDSFYEQAVTSVIVRRLASDAQDPGPSAG